MILALPDVMPNLVETLGGFRAGLIINGRTSTTPVSIAWARRNYAVGVFPVDDLLSRLVN